MVGASCNDASQRVGGGTENSPVLFANSTALHAMPQILNEYYNAVARSQTKSTTTDMSISSYPLPLTDRQTSTINSFQTVIVGFFILIPFTFVPSTYVSWIVKERECKAKHLQFVSGVNFICYWVSNFVFDIVSFFVTELLAMVIFALFGRSEYVGGDVILSTFLLFALYGFSAIAAAYAISFVFNNHSSAQTLVMLGNFLCGFVLVITMFFLQQIESTQGVADVLVFFFRVVPAYCLGEGILALATAPAKKQFGNTENIFAMDQAGWGMTYMAIECVLFSIITLLIDHPKRQLRKQQLFFDPHAVPPPINDEDEDVVEERQSVEAGSGERSKDVVKVINLRKVYPLGFGKEKVAVKNLTFGVKPGEVFGFLGTNGAGKTMTMSVLTGEFLPTMGHATICGHDVVSEAAETRRLIGYCPQFDALIDLLTPEEHLRLYAALRGVPKQSVTSVVNALLTACALEQYCAIPSKSLSGGNKRKLSVAISLIGGPSVVFLDEPSAGMDPHARRQLWDVIVYVAKHSSVVLTTHHLEEVDVLAHRVGIMVDGAMKCIGSLDHLKRKIGGGIEVSIKAFNDISLPPIRELVKAQFPAAALVEDRQLRLTYTLPFRGGAKLSYVFDVLQKAKAAGQSGISDYTVQQTSLEQVFLRISNNEADAKVPNLVAQDSEDPDGSFERQHSSFFLRQVSGGKGDIMDEEMQETPPSSEAGNSRKED